MPILEKQPVSRGSYLPRPKLTTHQAAWLQNLADEGQIDVTVCIANWNCQEYLWECLTSLQDIPQGVRLETIVVDNASTDGSAAMVAEDFPEVILIRNNKNVGFAKASNQAARKARGQYLFFLNNDTEVPAYTLARMVDYARRHPEVGILGPRLLDKAGKPQISYRDCPTVGAMLHMISFLRWTGLIKKHYQNYRRRSFTPLCEKRVTILLGAAILIPRNLFEAVGHWDEKFTFGVEDVELSTRISKTHELVYLPDVEIIHHGRLSSRENIVFSAPNLLIGYILFFRMQGTPRILILVYKIAVTLDIPFQLVAKSFQYLLRLVRGQKEKARKSRLAVKGMWRFATRDLFRFWRS